MKAMYKYKILIVGNFFGNKNNMPTTQAEELQKILSYKGINVLSASRYLNRVPRLLDTLFCIYKYRKQYEIVNIQFYGGFALILEDLASFLAKILNKKIIFTLHGGAIPVKVKEYPRWYSRVLKLGTIITCPSEYLITEMNHLNFPFCLIENSLPVSNYVFQDKKTFKPRLLWMRSFHPIYNPIMALEVLQLVQKHYPDAIMYMAGVDLGYKLETEQMVVKMGLTSSVVFPGFQDLDGKNKLASLCDIYMCTNRIDNTPVTLLEMMALGLPIVTTNVGGIPYMIKNNEAVLTDSEKPEQMANAILMILNNPVFVQSMISKGRSLVRSYDEDIIADKWIKLLESI